jgi:EmrB/QacA subfamily drug resistance transporter
MTTEPLTTLATTAPTPAEKTSRARVALVLVAVELGMLLAALDQTIVGTAMPRILADLNGFERYTWVSTAYLLAATVMVPIYGKLSDIYGRRIFFLGGMALFLTGSALSGVSQTMEQLIAFRALQGLGGGAIMPIVQAIIGDIFPPAERGKWQGMTIGVWGLATIFGPPLGGWITDTWSWRWVFYINLPLGVAAMLVAALALPRHRQRSAHRIDYAGAAGLVVTASALVLAFSLAGTTFAWGSPQILGLFAVALVGGGVFCLIERRAAEPIIRLDSFRNRVFTISVITTFLISAALFGTLLYMPLFLQGVQGQSAAASGTFATPLMIGVIVSGVAGGQVIARTGHYKLQAILGAALAAIGMFLLSRMTASASEGEIALYMVVLGLGIGASMTIFTVVVQSAFPRARLGQATSNLQFFREIGGVIGLAILGSVMTGRFQTHFEAALPSELAQGIPANQFSLFENPQLLLSPGAVARVQQGFAAYGPAGDALFAQLMATIRLGLAQAISDVFLVGAALITLGLVATFFLREIPLRRGDAREETESFTRASSPSRPSSDRKGFRPPQAALVSTRAVRRLTL